MANRTKVPSSEKYMLTIREAAEYFHLGEKALRELVVGKAGAEFLLEHGNRVLIKRKLFEEYLDKASVI